LPRHARIVLKGIAHHITQRGNYRQSIFSEDGDREKYIELVKKYSRKYKLKIYAYCLMTNHVHFIAVPEKEDSLAFTFKYTNMCYSNYYHRKNRKSGHLWQSRFYSCPLHYNHALEALRYVERNPVRAKMVEFPWDYQWSSAKAHVLTSVDEKTGDGPRKKNNGKEPSFYSCTLPLYSFNDLDVNWSPEGWKDYLGYPDDEDFLSKMRSNTFSGKPFFGDTLLEKLEEKLGVSLRKRKGRPAKRK
jgi:putative transposase